MAFRFGSRRYSHTSRSWAGATVYSPTFTWNPCAGFARYGFASAALENIPMTAIRATTRMRPPYAAIWGSVNRVDGPRGDGIARPDASPYGLNDAGAERRPARDGPR